MLQRERFDTDHEAFRDTARLPRTPTGKLMRRALRDRAIESSSGRD